MTRVLYVHGLESGPTGKKVQLLRAAGFEVRAVQMPCTRAHARREPLLLAWAASAVGLTLLALVAAAVGSTSPALAVLPLLGAGASFSRVKVAATRRVFERSLAVQRQALAEGAVDVVVGSSFGGAVTLALLVEGRWEGPTVLLCPAHQNLARRMRRPATPGLATLPEARARRVVVVHGTRDETVSVEDSRRLVEGSQARLVLVDDDHRLSATATAEGLSAWVRAALGEGAAGS